MSIFSHTFKFPNLSPMFVFFNNVGTHKIQESFHSARQNIYRLKLEIFLKKKTQERSTLNTYTYINTFNFSYFFPSLYNIWINLFSIKSIFGIITFYCVCYVNRIEICWTPFVSYIGFSYIIKLPVGVLISCKKGFFLFHTQKKKSYRQSLLFVSTNMFFRNSGSMFYIVATNIKVIVPKLYYEITNACRKIAISNI